jgi:hypothetical protein
VPLARFPVPDGLGGSDRYGALVTSRDRRRGGADGPAGGVHGPVTLPRAGSRERAFAPAILFPGIFRIPPRIPRLQSLKGRH